MNGHHKQLLPSGLMLPRTLGKPELLWPTWSVCASSSWSSTEAYSGQDPGWHPLSSKANLSGWRGRAENARREASEIGGSRGEAM